jgi:hypothetical protein
MKKIKTALDKCHMESVATSAVCSIGSIACCLLFLHDMQKVEMLYATFALAGIAAVAYLYGCREKAWEKDLYSQDYRGMASRQEEKLSSVSPQNFEL